MKASTKGFTAILLFLLSFLLAPPARLPAQVNTVQEDLYALTEKLVDAQFDHDFSGLAAQMHPKALSLFRRSVTAKFLKVCESHPKSQVLKTAGISETELESLSDVDFFVRLCEAAYKIEPAFVGNPDYLPITLLGHVDEPSGLAHVVYRYADKIENNNGDVTFLRPGVLTFYKSGGEWKIWSSLWADTIPQVWTLHLLKQVNSKK